MEILKERKHNMAYNAAVITVSDKGSKGQRVDTSGPALVSILSENGYNVIHTSIVPDERGQIINELIACCDQKNCTLVLTTGGTGFSPRDITPEATLAVIQRETRGIAEAMRAASMKVTPRGCLSRSAAGIRGRSLIVNLPGSEKAARENLLAVIGSIGHGLGMLCGEGSADCPAPAAASAGKASPSLDQWLKEAKQAPDAEKVGMYLTHNGTVRITPKAQVRNGQTDAAPVTGMEFSYDPQKLEQAIQEARKLEGIYYVRVWLNEGRLSVGDDLMYVLIGGDIRPHVVDALQFLVGTIKRECVVEKELH